ncbi:hypothetical protein K0T92_21595 [Paenibacillus oenotherae]|uniref:Uncharacterized protein n=1 Tax=Paenibacillus oenotherae TaxID=1435645 RepID=A0ABS7DBK5_9BACL|nr:hypothetical protein [Paenibacillus oenotherae]MBW7477317.1 hypothetical protein [Paenibacillus oenotherae]
MHAMLEVSGAAGGAHAVAVSGPAGGALSGTAMRDASEMASETARGAESLRKSRLSR